jgi:hypothetical protein
MDPQNSIQDNLKSLAVSPEIFEACEKIGKRLGLHIDQVGELDAQIREILRGTAKSSNFVRDIKRHLEINEDLAQKIAVEVNKDVFDAIKRNLQAHTTSDELTPAASIHADLEQAGRFTIMPEKREAARPGDITHDDKGRLLNNLESMANEPVTPGLSPLVNNSGIPANLPVEPEITPAPVVPVPIPAATVEAKPSQPASPSITPIAAVMAENQSSAPLTVPTEPTVAETQPSVPSESAGPAAAQASPTPQMPPRPPSPAPTTDPYREPPL